jgi:ribosomal protein S27AE
MTTTQLHRLTVEATPNRPWPYRWRCSCGVEGSADTEADAATKHAAHADKKPRIPPCPSCGGKRGTFMGEQNDTLSWTCSRCGDEWSDVGGDRG